jgi:mannobiose 2-epimerase
MREKLSAFANELNDELNRILKYWQENSVDKENGGFIGQIDHFSHTNPLASKGAVLNTRILWAFSAAYNFTKNPEYLKIAKRAYEYIRDFFLDKENGGLIWEVNHVGKPVNTRKQTYAQGFGIYGFSEYFRVSGDKESLRIAKVIFHLLEKHCYDLHSGGYLEALSHDWQPMDDMRLSPKDENYPKSMNTHLHILEPYTNLYRVWKNDALAGQMKNLIRTFLDHIVDQKTGHFHLFFEKDWTVKSEIISYGHDIEGAWLLTEAAEVLGDMDLLKEVEAVAIKMTHATLAEGTAGDGSLFYERESSPGHLDTDKHWWPQAEAVIGFLNAYQISGDEVFLQKSMQTWEFIKNHMLDKKNGEWYWSVDENGIPGETNNKAGFWKCPYHNSRACMEGVHRINQILKSLK